MIRDVWFWLKNSRVYSLPMTLLSWLVIFVYSFKSGGNALNGLAAMFGICCAHLAANLFDDYMDYRILTSTNCQKCKCEYIKDGSVSLDNVLRVVCLYCILALLTGLYLFIRCGFPVLVLAFVGAVITLCYSLFSRRGLGEIAVGTAFGPLLFEGVYFVMCGHFSLDVLILSLAVVMFTVGLLYVHTVLDFEGDMEAGKVTLACKFGNKTRAIDGVIIIYGLGFLLTLILAFRMHNYWLLLVFILLPLIFELYNSLKSFTCGGDVAEFYSRFIKARNLMVYYSIIVTLLISR